jgi:serine/threonine protein kinase
MAAPSALNTCSAPDMAPTGPQGAAPASCPGDAAPMLRPELRLGPGASTDAEGAFYDVSLSSTLASLGGPDPVVAPAAEGSEAAASTPPLSPCPSPVCTGSGADPAATAAAAAAAAASDPLLLPLLRALRQLPGLRPSPAMLAALNTRATGGIAAAYAFERQLGKGGYASVYLARPLALPGGLRYACKAIALPDSTLPPQQQSKRWGYLQAELEALAELRGTPGVNCLQEWLVDGGCVYLVLELAAGGDLLGPLLARGRLSEREARQLAKRVLHTLAGLHDRWAACRAGCWRLLGAGGCWVLSSAAQPVQTAGWPGRPVSMRAAKSACMTNLAPRNACRGIVHRDIKPENILLPEPLPADGPADFSQAQLADFGLSARTAGPGGLFYDGSCCGTPPYAAPEVHQQQPYGTKADMWSFGVLMYTLLSGYLPWSTISPRQALVEQVCAGRYGFHWRMWGGVSAGAMQLVAGLMQLDPDKRLSARQAMEHPWLAADVDDV